MLNIYRKCESKHHKTFTFRIVGRNEMTKIFYKISRHYIASIVAEAAEKIQKMQKDKELLYFIFTTNSNIFAQIQT